MARPGTGGGSGAGPSGVDSIRSAQMEMYEVKEQVGKGSFGNAFLVIHRETQQKMVMKKVRLARQTEAQRKASFREMELVQGLNHPFVVRCHDAWVERGHTICVVYGYCDAGDLASFLQRKAKGKSLLPEEQTRKWCAQMALGLEYLHSHNILHRDLKSSNIFLTSSGDLQIGDFGLAKVLDAGETATSIVGTPNYMCPELLSEKPYDFKCDIWSLGCILYELTALRPAFSAFNMQGLVTKIKKAQFPPLPAGYCAEWGSMVKSMIRRSPEERPSVSELTKLQFMHESYQAARHRAEAIESGEAGDAEGGWFESASAGAGGGKLVLPPALRKASLPRNAHGRPATGELASARPPREYEQQLHPPRPQTQQSPYRPVPAMEGAPRFIKSSGHVKDVEAAIKSNPLAAHRRSMDAEHRKPPFRPTPAANSVSSPEARRGSPAHTNSAAAARRVSENGSAVLREALQDRRAFAATTETTSLNQSPSKPLPQSHCHSSTTSPSPSYHESHQHRHHVDPAGVDNEGREPPDSSNAGREEDDVEGRAGSVRDAGLDRSLLLQSLALCGRLYQRGRLGELGQVLCNFVDLAAVPVDKRSPFQLGDKVVVGKSRRLEGLIRYFGEVAFAHGDWVGIELDKPEGRNDGTVQGINYFACPPNCGLFVRASILQPESMIAKDRLAANGGADVM